ncbi:unnamed protein product [Soboliphyme baturini]|uniref:SUEL-type lectin domain-containing protein n=1 Tax=Soboliphyme baturini TaxID=241478 RepID=A0A183IR10_9BILA|nr:unnamed protein product [Soboliphyme baturini]
MCGNEVRDVVGAQALTEVDGCEQHKGCEPTIRRLCVVLLGDGYAISDEAACLFTDADDKLGTVRCHEAPLDTERRVAVDDD